MDWLNEISANIHNGKKLTEEKINWICNYIKSFDTIIRWGAGNLGQVVEKKLREFDISISAYWDIRANEIGEKDGIPVIEPFGGGFAKEKTLVIFCIANVPVSPRLYHMLAQEGWTHHFKGTLILEGLICPLSVEAPIDTSICSQMDICSVCSCERLTNMMKNQEIKERALEEKDFIYFDRVHFIINNFCNLKCRYCNRYMNSYPNEWKRNLSAETICADIDMVMEAIHSLGVVIVFGGEPFLHPELDKIVEKILEKRNFGTLLIDTNGVAPIKER